MGKSKPGLFTPVTGKVGGVVYYYRNGRQVQRIWVQPSNPKTKGQNDARLKFSLAGKLSSIVPPEALAGMNGSNKPERRSRFNRNIILNSNVSNNKVEIADGNVIFSEGTVPVALGHTVAEQPTSGIYRGVQITVTRSANPLVASVPEGYGERYVVLFLNANTSQFDYAVTGILPTPTEAGQSEEIPVSVRVGDSTTPYIAITYVCPFVQQLGSGKFNTSNIGFDEDAIIVDQDTGELIKSVDYGTSLLIGRTTLNPPATMHAAATDIQRKPKEATTKEATKQ